MSSLFTSLLSSANSLRAYEQALAVTQNNVTNSSTPGYAKQIQPLEALSFDVTVGLPGGVRAGSVLSSRDGYAERAVREQQTDYGFSQQKTTNLTPLETSFSLSGTSGIAPSISALFQSFSSLSVNPNDTVSRQAVIQQASIVAGNFRSTAAGLQTQETSLDQESRGTIDAINHLATVIAGINTHNRLGKAGSSDAGVDAQLNSSLEELSQLVNFTSLQQPDGTVAIYIGGQTALVANDKTYPIKGDFSTSQTKILNSTGADISNQLTGGKLGALLEDKNTVIPSYVTDLNTLAQGLADNVNTALSQGVDQNGAAPATNLFTYDPTVGAAFSLAVNPLTPDQIAAASPGATGGNGNALSLAALGDTKSINGYTFAQFYGNLGGRVGSDLALAKSNQSTQQLLLTQTQDLRTQVSGVSLNEEAEHLVAFQRAYEATSKMIGILDSLTETLINIIK
jgi:flagellar hook-associated protein 1